MALESLETAPALSEKIPHKILAAAKRVDISVYLQLQYQFNRGHLSDEEYRQISDGATAIMYDAAKSGNKCYDPGDEIERSADPLVIWARWKLTKVPLAEYLVARVTVLETAKASTTKQINEYEAAGVYVNGLERANNRLNNLLNDLGLTNKVAAAAEIALDANI